MGRVLATVAVGLVGVLVGCTDSTHSSDPILSPSTQHVNPNACAGGDPLTVASTFLAAVNAKNQALYTQCVYSDASGDDLTVTALSPLVSTVREGDFVVTDVIQRPEHMYAFNSRANIVAEATATSGPVFDVGGRVDVTVSLKPDGNYYVTRIGYEVHG
jgi:hypothetical protein